MAKFSKPLWLAFAVALAALLAGCDKRGSQDQSGDVADTPYSVWVTGRRLSGDELSQALNNNPDYANLLCQQDINRPPGYRQHIGLVSTAQLDRKDLAQKYRWDISKPVSYAGSEQLVSARLGDLLLQQGPILISNEDSKSKIKLTLSVAGEFSGYCGDADSSGYTPVVGNPISEEIKRFTARCSEPGVIVCLSIK